MLNIGIQALRNKWLIDFGYLPEYFIESSYLRGLIRRKMKLNYIDDFGICQFKLW